jgi:hypothetical protein
VQRHASADGQLVCRFWAKYATTRGCFYCLETPWIVAKCSQMPSLPGIATTRDLPITCADLRLVPRKCHGLSQIAAGRPDRLRVLAFSRETESELHPSSRDISIPVGVSGRSLSRARSESARGVSG